MKSDWDKLTKENKNTIAIQLLKSMRGSYIISQALYYAILKLEKVKEPHKEVSNIQDMKILRECLFPLFIPISKKLLKELQDKHEK